MESKQFVKLLYDYRAITEDEVSGKKDETFELLSDEDQVWWFVKKMSNAGGDDDDGFIPKTYLKVSQHDEKTANLILKGHVFVEG